MRFGTDGMLMTDEEVLRGWGDVDGRDLRPVRSLRLHPSADDVPGMTPDEYDSLLLDIEERGIVTPRWWKPTRRHCLLPLPLLRAVFAEHRDAWADEFGRYQQRNRGWTSECVFVPRVVVWRAIYERFGGVPNRRAA